MRHDTTRLAVYKGKVLKPDANGHLGKIEPGTRVADIDNGLVPLITLLWQLDIDTEMCCEKQLDDLVWIMMPSAAADRLFDILTKYFSTNLLRCVPYISFGRLPKEIEKGKWYVSAGWDGKLFINFRFPPEDLPELEKCLAQELLNVSQIPR